MYDPDEAAGRRIAVYAERLPYGSWGQETALKYLNLAMHVMTAVPGPPRTRALASLVASLDDLVHPAEKDGETPPGRSA